MSTTSKEELLKILSNIKEEELKRECEELAKDPKKLNSDIQKFINGMNEEQIQQGIEEKGGVKAFIESIIKFLAFQTTLVRYGVTIGIAAGVSAAILYGTSSLVESIGNSIDASSVAEFSNGISIAGDFANEISNAGFEVAEASSGLFSQIIDGVSSLLS
ncbi:MAG: hypothetical protein KDK90_26460 [Leptospiraceae bacterium]|nr:hypothetical protein [Leptospiraceae bacterium]